MTDQSEPMLLPEKIRNCQHEFAGQRAGGSPCEAGSYEYVEWCIHCGVESAYVDPEFEGFLWK